jgi:hypothetical protein
MGGWNGGDPTIRPRAAHLGRSLLNFVRVARDPHTPDLTLGEVGDLLFTAIEVFIGHAFERPMALSELSRNLEMSATRPWEPNRDSLEISHPQAAWQPGLESISFASSADESWRSCDPRPAPRRRLRGSVTRRARNRNAGSTDPLRQARTHS